MVKALPDKHVDPSPLGIDNIISQLPLPDLDLKRGLPLGLDNLLGGSSKGHEGGPSGYSSSDGSKYASYVPLDKQGSPITPHSHDRASTGLPIIGDLPLVGHSLDKGTPLAPLKGILEIRTPHGSANRAHLHHQVVKKETVCGPLLSEVQKYLKLISA